MYAVLETGGKQYRVKSGDKLEIERLDVEAGKPVTFNKILMVNNDGDLKVGAPTVDSATVVADVLKHKRVISVVRVTWEKVAQDVDLGARQQNLDDGLRISY